MGYSGYLAPHLEKARRLREAGIPLLQVAGCLYAEDRVRAPCPRDYWTIDDELRAIAGSLSGALNQKPKRTQSTRWQAWTPEMQEAEFQREYAGR
jgi:hypothetical protein